jgi:hypothetical protein
VSDTELESALLHLRTSVIACLVRKLGGATDRKQVHGMLARNTDAQVFDTLVQRSKEPSRWRSILRWVQGLRGVF